MGQTAGTIFGAAGVGFGANAQLRAGAAAKKAGDYNASAIVNEADYNSRVASFNADVADLQAKDAVSRGQIAESTSRAATGAAVGAERASYGAQGLNLDVGSPMDVVKSTAFGGVLDAMSVRLNAAREGWGYKVQSAGDTAQADAIKKKGAVDAYNAKTGGEVAQAAGRSNAAATILGGAGQLIAQRYGYRKGK